MLKKGCKFATSNQLKHTTMTYTTTEINQNFRIKVNGLNNEGNKINTLVGVSGAIALIGEELFEKFINRAYNQGQDACVCKLRRGLKMTLYSK